MKDVYKNIDKALQKEEGVISAYVLGSFLNKSKPPDDFDLAIVTYDKNLKHKDIYKLLLNVSFPADLDLSIVNKSSSPLFLFQVIKNGKLIYSKDEKLSKSFEEFVMKNYWDTQHIRNIYNSYLPEKFNLKQYAN